jgi:biopolymer transport protein ExbB
MHQPHSCSLRVLFFLLAVGGLQCLAAHGVFAQEGSDLGAPATAPADHSVLQTILGSGPLGLAIWVAILGASVTMVTFVIQNLISLRNDRLAPKPLIDSLQQVIGAGNYQEAWEICNANRNYLANTLKAGLERVGRGKDLFDDALAEHGLREAQLLRTRNSYLSVIGVVSPMIGLLGTVIGMMRAFSVLGSEGISNPRALATSIGEVLLATASGLFIAIPAFIFYYVFRNRTQAVIVHAEDKINVLVEDIPFEELQGVRIGENFSAGAGDEGTPGAKGSRRVSMALSTNCPVCNATVDPGTSPCPHCGAKLEWNR